MNDAEDQTDWSDLAALEAARVRSRHATSAFDKHMRERQIRRERDHFMRIDGWIIFWAAVGATLWALLIGSAYLIASAF